MDIEKLKTLGLSPYEAKCYLALLVSGNLLGKDVARLSGVPPTSVYRNLESLHEKGFVQVIQKQPLVYQAVAPEIAVSANVKLQKQGLDELQKKAILELRSAKQQRTENIGNAEKIEEVLEVHSGREQSYELGRKLVQQSKKEILLIGRGTSQSILDLIHSLKSAVKRKVPCKFIVTTYDQNKDLITQLQKSGVKVKYHPLRGFSLLVKDRQESQIVIKNGKLKEKRIVLNVKNKDLSEALAYYFDSVWKRSTPL